MPDIDDLLGDDTLARAASAAAAPPAYEDVVRRGLRKRATRRAAVAGSAALAVITVFGVGQLLDSSPGGTPQPAGPTPTHEKATDGSSPFLPRSDTEAVVDDPSATIERVVAHPDDPSIRAVQWLKGNHVAVAITDDGFHTRTTVESEGVVGHVSGSTFALLDGSDIRYVQPGQERTVGIGAARPAGPDDVILAHTVGYGREVVAIDPVTEEAHYVPIPDVRYWDLQVFGGRIQAIEYRESEPDSIVYHWSDDGGATWESMTVGANWWSFVVPTAADEDHLIVESGDGATVNPFVAVHRMRPDSQAFVRTAVEGDQRMSLGGEFVWQGELRLFPDPHAFGEAEVRGLSRFVDGGFAPVSTTLKPIDAAPAYSIVGRTETANGTELWLSGEGDHLYRSLEPSGERWEEAAAR